MGMRRPQIIINEKTLSSFVAPTGDRVAVMLGSANWGPISTLTNVSALSDFVSKFGDERSTTGLTLIKGADLFFRNGGTLKVIRLDDGDAAKSDFMAVSGVTDMINFEGYYKGTYGDLISLTIATIGSNRSLVVSDGSISEIYDNSGLGYSTNALLAVAVNTGSTLVTAAVESGQEATLVADLTKTYLTGGDDGENNLDTADFTTAFDNLLLNEEFNYMLCPGQTDNAFDVAMVARLVSRAASEEIYARYLGGIAVDETITTLAARTGAGKRFSRLSPSVSYENRYSGDSSVIDGSYLAAAYCGKLCTLDYGESMTNKTINIDDLSILESTGTKYYTKTQQEQVLQTSTIPIANINGSIRAVRAITTLGDESSLYFEEIIVDMSDFIRSELKAYFDGFLGEPNTAENRSLIAAGTDSKLISYRNLGYITEYTNTSVIAGSSSDSMIATVGYKPVRATNFIYTNINIS